MSIKKISKEQPKVFEFNKKNIEEANKIISNYPNGKQQSAVMPLLYIAQKQNNNWIPLAAMKYVAKFLDMPYIKVYEVATFYSMYNLSPVGDYFIQVCTTTPCMIRGAYKLVEVCKDKVSKKKYYGTLKVQGDCITEMKLKQKMRQIVWFLLAWEYMFSQKFNQKINLSSISVLV